MAIPYTPISAPSPLQAPPHDNARGFLFMTLGFCFFGLTDMLAKLLTEHLPLMQVVWFRQSGLFLGVVTLLALRGSHVLRTPHPLLQVMRGVIALGSAACFIMALRHVGLADATAVTFTAPFLVTIFGALLLKEPVGPRRWAAVVTGFIGMLVVIRPGMGVFHPAIGFAFVSAVCFAARQLLSRYLSGADSIATTVSYTSLTSFLLCSIPLAVVWQTPESGWVLLLCLMIAAAAGLGEFLLIRGLDLGQAVVMAPVQYTMIIWSTLYGFLVFADLPDAWTFVGCGIIIASGLYTLYRERVLAKRARRVTEDALRTAPSEA
ncbi:DMT family transporter [Yangia mangrovi]|uniref:DMT family transporter n=1 Tax=Alloyangia mangrovi TaxID=1779329 RepID=A0A2A3K2M3_9RHOB|nr:DMT family transporter [Alloyangia mangrovi]MCT4371105.1 DMT family transporter [Alloyangia mangrovi]